MHSFEALRNRIDKNLRTRGKWAQREGFDAYRVYERDIPEFRYTVDRYGDEAVVFDQRSHTELDSPDQEAGIVDAVASALRFPHDRIHVKRRRRIVAREDQYGRLAQNGRTKTVAEGGARFLVNLTDYLDTGLFLDHRPLRLEFAQLPKGLRFLNLFCYTGTASVAAALSGAKTTSVDLSNTYLEWARRNFRENRFDDASHELVREDARRFLEDANLRKATWDVIFLDPPTFSNSKKMQGTFDVRRDHADLIALVMGLLTPSGKLYFSTNSRSFSLDDDVRAHTKVEDITTRTIPPDVRDAKAHRAYILERI